MRTPQTASNARQKKSLTPMRKRLSPIRRITKYSTRNTHSPMKKK